MARCHARRRSGRLPRLRLCNRRLLDPKSAFPSAPCIRIKQQLIGIEAVASLRLIRAMHAKAIKCCRANLRHVAVENFVGTLWQFEAANLAAAFRVEEANLDPRRIG